MALKSFVLICVVGVLAAFSFSSGLAIAAEFELTPNPNPGTNTITIPSGDVGINSAELFENFGAIVVQGGSTLRNVTEMDIFCDEGVVCGPGSVTINFGGTLETLANSTMNFDTLSHFTINGTVNNAGDISSDGRFLLAFAFGQFNNSGTFNNKAAADFRGPFVNTGTLLNSTPAFEAGGLIQQVDQFTNEAGAVVLNHGEFVNFATVTNRGSITNEVFATGGIGRGIFRNRFMVDNLASGVITNRNRWFNDGTLKNAGLFDNTPIGTGLSNSASIINLAGGTFQNSKSLSNTGTILNAGDFFIDATVGGSGSYTQTAGKTVVNVSLAASTIDIQGGLLTGTGTLTGPVSIGSTATVSPGSSPGMLSIVGNYTQQAGSTLAIEIGGLVAGTELDVLDITGSATLAGTLAVSLFDLGSGVFAPSLGNAFDILTATDGIVGVFASESLPTLSSGLAWEVNYGANVVTLNVLSLGLTADFDGDTDVDGADLATWESAFAVNSNADTNGDGVSDGSDFLAWQRQFTGPGPLGAATAVPEPTGAALLLAALACLGLPRRSGNRDPASVLAATHD